jgi:hypothetical protein
MEIQLGIILIHRQKNPRLQVYAQGLFRLQKAISMGFIRIGLNNYDLAFKLE